MTPLWFKRRIVLGMYGPDVDVVRRKLGLEPGPYDRTTMEKVKGMARRDKIETNGEVDELVAERLGESEANQRVVTPSWWYRELEMRRDEGEDVRSLRKILGLGDADNRFDADLEAAVRRFQSGLGLEPTGKVDVDLARQIGEV